MTGLIAQAQTSDNGAAAQGVLGATTTAANGNYLGWILGAIVLVIVIGTIVFLMKRSAENK